MEALKRQCINLIVDESLNTDSRAEYIATLLINGTGAAPLKEMTEEVLVQEVYDRCSYRFTSDEDYQLGHNVLSPGKDPNYTKIVSALLKLFSGLKDHEWNKLKIERTLYKVLEDRFYVKSLLKMELK
jgi:hypothetical protein